VLGRIFGLKREEVTGSWRKLLYEELNNLYSSPNIVRLIKSRRMRWAGHVARMGQMKNEYKVLVENLKERDNFEDIRGWDDNIKMGLRESRGRARTGLVWLRIGSGGELL
jgi:hypothetical protein